MPEDWKNGGFGLYIHWPFCQSKCPYCDFNSHVAADIDQTRWIRAYCSEIRRSAAETPGRVLNSIFFGGGTPSLMAVDTVSAILSEVRDCWTFANDIEITLEANPGSVEAQRFAGYAKAGVNRISMGFQALNDPDLKRLGRLHTVSESLKALEIARGAFDRVSFDLIYARQDQSVEDWKRELKQALSFDPDHLSLYQLTIEDGTAFGDRYNAGKLKGLPEEDASAEMYFATQDICENAGLPAYEVSNHAQNGQQSRHNLIYWRYGDYLGIGPGAHGRVTLGKARFATETHLSPALWLAAAERGTGETRRSTLSREDQAVEYLMMSLRLSEGSEIGRYQSLSGQDLPEQKIRDLDKLGLVKADGNRLRCTAKGRPVLNGILRELLT
ncbi:MAG: radical SAM family heme chaperone HemW [Paracoccaceae bacterium]|nr:radical SAM family heme chaperone HemW [Paracoccaceae bacterium]